MELLTTHRFRNGGLTFINVLYFIGCLRVPEVVLVSLSERQRQQAVCHMLLRGNEGITARL